MENLSDARPAAAGAGEVRFAAEAWVARRAAAEAAALILARPGADAVRPKSGPADLVTETDEAAERVIISCIRRHFPEDTIVAEESAASGPGGRTWYIDPIDGTTNFVHGHPFACVSIAFADADGPAAAVIHAPLLGEIYHAVRGGGAFLNDQPLRASQIGDAASALFATGFPFKGGKGDPEPYFKLVLEVMRASHGIRRAGSAALDLAYVAAGRVDGFFEIGLSPWDVAAGMLLVTEAGGHISGWPGDKSPPLDSGRIIASNGRLHEWIQAVAGSYGI